MQLDERLSAEQKLQIQGYFSLKALSKKQYLLSQGDTCKHISFVASGLLKSYTLDEQGKQHISLFGQTGWWISDFPSFIFQGKAALNIDAIEDSVLLLLSKENYDKLLQDIPVMEKYFRLLYQNSLATKDIRLISANANSALQRYQLFLKAYPDIAARLPQHLIASYLGLSAETISRIKRKLLKANS